MDLTRFVLVCLSLYYVFQILQALWTPPGLLTAGVLGVMGYALLVYVPTVFLAAASAAAIAAFLNVLVLRVIDRPQVAQRNRTIN